MTHGAFQVASDLKQTELVLFGKRYFEWMLITGYSKYTVESRSFDLKDFFSWCDQRGLNHPGDINRSILESYRRSVYYTKKKDGNSLNVKTQNLRLQAVKSYFKWLSKNHFILFNPAFDLELPRIGYPLPKGILSTDDIEKVFEVIDTSTYLGIRDRAIMELFYSTGIRRRELSDLKIHDINFAQGTIMIRLGKWKKDRLIPVGSGAIFWVEKYLNEIRSEFVIEPDEEFLFLSKSGSSMKVKYLSYLVSRYMEKAGVGGKGFSCHAFRHSMATQMLEGGADIRFVQEMLGHTKLDSTQIYTRVSIGKLKEVHSKTHPGINIRH